MRFVVGAPSKIMFLGLSCNGGEAEPTEGVLAPFRMLTFDLRRAKSEIAHVVTFLQGALVPWWTTTASLDLPRTTGRAWLGKR